MAIKVLVGGASGKMGQLALACLTAEQGFEICGTVLRGDDINTKIDALKPDVYLDLTVGAIAGKNGLASTGLGIPTVIGATGIPGEEVAALEKSGVPCLLVPNFALGAVLMMRFAAMAARWLPDAEIIELHHERKIDAPSGTAMRTAEMISEARINAPTELPTPFLKASGARGANVQDVPVHSVRLRGMLAHQEVIFGGQGEVLTVRHDSLDRSSFAAGIILSCREIGNLKGFHVGLETLLF